jgi:NADH:ubiquinone oxidoreductase subunit E
VGTGSVNVIEQFPEKRAELEAYINSLPLTDNPDRNRGFLIQSLHKAQEIFTFLPSELQLFVADKLRLHLSEVYGVISFYSFFTDKPVGKYKINICTGTACFVKGANKIMDEFRRYLGISEGETSEDGKFSLGALRCVGACSLAPVVMVNEKVYGNVTTKMVPEIINECED